MLKNETASHDAQRMGVAAAAEAIRTGAMSSEAYAASLLQRARAAADLNAFITIDETAVLAAAREADKARTAGSVAPLLGVPIAVKDSYLTQGLRTTLGVGNLDRHVPAKDAAVVASIKAAGGIVFGKNNLVEMSWGITGNNGAYGQARNPYDTDRVTGGSSSGAGASVAAGLVPAALGGDTVGSIRVPAALSGVVGFKPSAGRWSGDGVAPISHTLDTTGVLARTVEDCALIDQIVTKHAPSPLPIPQSDLRGIRLAHAPRQYLEHVDPEVEARFVDTLLRLRDAGAELVEVDLGDDFITLTERSAWAIFFHETMDAVSDFVHRHDVPVSFDDIIDGLRPALQGVWRHVVVPTGAGYVSPEAYSAAVSLDRPEIQRRFQTAFNDSGTEALLFPTTPTTAPLIEHQTKFTVANREVNDLVLARHTVGASVAGLPGISLPMGLSANGLPMGLELDGARGDRRLLEVASRVQAVIGTLPPPHFTNRGTA